MVKNFDLKTFLVKNKNLLIMIVSILFLIILGILVYIIYDKGYFSTTNKPTVNSESNQEDKSEPLIKEIYLTKGKELEEIKAYLQINIFNKYSHLISNSSTKEQCRLFNFNPINFNPPTYNSIDKTIMAQKVINGETIYVVQPGGFGCPIKDAPSNLVAVYFDGGSKRGGDEDEDEEGNEIPKYTLEDLKTMHNGGIIYIFYNKNIE